MNPLLALGGAATPLLDAFFEGVTMLGEPVVLAGAFCLIYWCIDKEAGLLLLTGLYASLCLNGLIKDIVKAPRPFWDGSEAKRVETATGYSFPSGHSQSASAFWTGFALWQKRRRVTVLVGALLLLVGFSRLYLRVHYPRDVVWGLALGAVCAVLIRAASQRLPRWIVPTAVTLLALGCLVLGESEDTLAAAGLAAGLPPGVLLEKRVNFSPPDSLFQGAARLLAGVLLIGIIFLVSKLLPTQGAALLLPRGALITFVAVGGYPWLFSRLERRRS